MEKSIKDSNRFGLNIHRSKTDDFNVKEIKRYIYENDVDILILRLNSTKKDEHSKLYSIGFPVIHCDTLVYYECDLESYNPKELKNDVKFEEIQKFNEVHLEEIVPLIFKDYKNHYTSNYLLNKQGILEGYVEWAKDYLSDQSRDKISWYTVGPDQDIYGFATCSFNDQIKECEGVLYGIIPEKSGGGLYGDMIRFTQRYFKESGYKKMKVSTQIQNFAVQRVWSREGFHLKSSYDTYHINAFSGSSGIKYVTDLVIRDEDIAKFGEISGDKNPLHFDDEYARKLGFKGRIVHGIRYEVELTRIIGTEWPGSGTIILSSRVIFNKPVYPSVRYKLMMKSVFEQDNGYKELVALLKDPDGEIVNIAYINVLQR